MANYTELPVRVDQAEAALQSHATLIDRIDADTKANGDAIKSRGKLQLRDYATIVGLITPIVMLGAAFVSLKIAAATTGLDARIRAVESRPAASAVRDEAQDARLDLFDQRERELRSRLDRLNSAPAAPAVPAPVLPQE